VGFLVFFCVRDTTATRKQYLALGLMILLLLLLLTQL